MIEAYLSVLDGEAHREGEPPCEPAWKMARTEASPSNVVPADGPTSPR